MKQLIQKMPDDGKREGLAVGKASHPACDIFLAPVLNWKTDLEPEAGSALCMC